MPDIFTLIKKKNYYLHHEDAVLPKTVPSSESYTKFPKPFPFVGWDLLLEEIFPLSLTILWAEHN
jgi:hypothetical protein